MSAVPEPAWQVLHRWMRDHCWRLKVSNGVKPMVTTCHPQGMVMTVGWRTFEALRRRGLIERADHAEDGTWYRLTEAGKEL